MTDADQGGEWVTGIIGESFQVDKDGNPIPHAPSDAPAELPSGSDVWDAINDTPAGGADASQAAPGGWLDGLDATGILGGSGQIGGNDDETQKEIWREMDSGELGGGAAGSLPPDVETLL